MRQWLWTRKLEPEDLTTWGSDTSDSSSAASRTVELGKLHDGRELRSRSVELARQYAKMDVSWARCRHVRALRDALLTFGLNPLMDLYTRHRTAGREVFHDLRPPVIFVANHSSHLDTPTILRAIPRKWRSRTAVGAAADYFYKSRWKARAVALLFNTVPIARTGGGLGSGARDHVDKLIQERWNLLIFPEGTRSRDGRIGDVRSGAAVIAAQNDIDIVPIYVHGTHTAMPPGRNWPKRLPGRFFSRRHRARGLLRRADPPGRHRPPARRHGRGARVLGGPGARGRRQAARAGRAAHAPGAGAPLRRAS